MVGREGGNVPKRANLHAGEKDVAIPYYVRVAQTIRRRIIAGEYPDGTLIPPSPGLEKEFSVSNITIRKALEMLARDGLIARRRGVGTVVSRPDSTVVVFELTGSFRTMVNSVNHLPMEAQVLDMGVVRCPDWLARLLDPPATGEIWQMKKVRRHQGVPISYYVHYLHPKWGEKVTKEAAEAEPIVDLFQKFSSVKLHALHQRLEAAVADLDLAAILEVPFGSPLFFIENLYCDADGKPLMLNQIYYRGDKCLYKSKTVLDP